MNECHHVPACVRSCVVAQMTLWKRFRLLLPEPHARPVLVEEFDPGFLKNRDDPVERFRSRAYRPIEALHAADSAARNF